MEGLLNCFRGMINCFSSLCKKRQKHLNNEANLDINEPLITPKPLSPTIYSHDESSIGNLNELDNFSIPLLSLKSIYNDPEPEKPALIKRNLSFSLEFNHEKIFFSKPLSVPHEDSDDEPIFPSFFQRDRSRSIEIIIKRAIFLAKNTPYKILTNLDSKKPKKPHLIKRKSSFSLEENYHAQKFPISKNTLNLDIDEEPDLPFIFQRDSSKSIENIIRKPPRIAKTFNNRLNNIDDQEPTLPILIKRKISFSLDINDSLVFSKPNKHLNLLDDKEPQIPFVHRRDSEKSIERFESSVKFQKSETPTQKVEILDDSEEPFHAFIRTLSLNFSFPVCCLCSSNGDDIYGFLCDHNICLACLTKICTKQIKKIFSVYKKTGSINNNFQYRCPIINCNQVIPVPTHMIITRVRKDLLDQDFRTKNNKLLFFEDDSIFQWLIYLDGMN